MTTNPPPPSRNVTRPTHQRTTKGPMRGKLVGDLQTSVASSRSTHVAAPRRCRHISRRRRRHDVACGDGRGRQGAHRRRARPDVPGPASGCAPRSARDRLGRVARDLPPASRGDCAARWPRNCRPRVARALVFGLASGRAARSRPCPRDPRGRARPRARVPAASFTASRLIAGAQDDDAGMRARRVGPDITEPAIEGEDHASLRHRVAEHADISGAHESLVRDRLHIVATLDERCGE